MSRIFNSDHWQEGSGFPEPDPQGVDEARAAIRDDHILSAEFIVNAGQGSQMETTEDCGDYEIVITEIQSHWLSFVVYEVLGREADGKLVYNRENYRSSPDPVNDRKKAQKFMEGSIKWDGCANFTVEDQPLHFCGLADAEAFGKILPTIYRLASELFANWEG